MANKTPNFTGTTIAAVVAIAYWIVGSLCWSMASVHTQSAPVWLSAGVVFGALLVAPQGRWAAVLIGAIVASYVWGLTAHGLDALAAAPFALIEVVSIAAGAWIARRAMDGSTHGVSVAGWLICGAMVTAGLGATLAAEFWRWQRPGVLYSVEWRAWGFSTLVGILLAAPVVQVFRGFKVKRSGGMPMMQFAAGSAVFLVFLAVAITVFGANDEERFGTLAATLGYLPMPFLLLSAMIWGPRGGALAMLTGSLLVIGLTAGGGGPFMVSEGFVGEAVIEVQAYVAVWTALMVLARSLSESRREAWTQAREWQLRYERILGATGTASVEFDAVTGAATWDEQAATVLGREIWSLRGITDWHARINTSDRARAEAAWQAVARGQQSTDRSLYPVRLGQQEITVEAQLAAVRGPDGAVEYVAGLLRPVDNARGANHHG